jgi:hypothetical protein
LRLVFKQKDGSIVSTLGDLALRYAAASAARRKLK